MVRSPSREKGGGLKKGPWTPEEDQKLLAYIEEHGHGSWQALPAKAGLKRCGKSCRLRWTNYLRPDIKRGKFSLQEEQTIIQLHALLGNKWSAIATHLPKRTDNEIKNYWNTHLKKRLDRMGIDPVTHKPKADAFGYGSGHSKDVANLSHMAQWESARLEAEARLVRESKLASKPLPNQFGFSAPLLRPQFAAAAAVSVSSPKSTPQARPRCLDVLKAWQRMVSGMFFASTDTLESPTSTLNFSDHTLPIPTVASLNDNSISLLQFPNPKGEVGLEEELDNKITSSENEWKCVFQKPKNLALVKEAMDGSVIAMNEMGGTYNDHGGEVVEADNAWIFESLRAANGNEINIGNMGDGELSDMLVYNNSSSSNMGGVGDEAGESCNGNSKSNHNNNSIEDQGNYWNSLLNLVDAPSSASPPLF